LHNNETAFACGGNEIAGQRIAYLGPWQDHDPAGVVQGSAKRSCLWVLAASLLQMLTLSIYLCRAADVMPVLVFANSSFSE